METSDIQDLKRRLRRGSSLYNSTSVKSDSGTNVEIYAAQLRHEKKQWIEFQTKILNDKKIPEQPIKCDMNIFDTKLKEYCKAAPDIATFSANTREFTAKLETYVKMENYHMKKLKYAEDTLKENVDELMKKIFVDQIVEKIHM